MYPIRYGIARTCNDTSPIICQPMAFVRITLACCRQIAKTEQELSSKRLLAFSKAVVEVRFAEEAVKTIGSIENIEEDPELLQGEVNEHLPMHLPCTYFVIAIHTIQ